MPPAETTRCFFALALPESTTARLARWVEAQLAPEARGVRWASPDSLHVTLAFLGDVASERLESLAGAVSAACAPLEPFALEVCGLGAFPDAGRPRIIWAGLQGPDLPRLAELQRTVAGAAKGAGHPPPDERFSPHITLGRIKGGSGRPPDLSALVRKYVGWTAGPIPAAEVVLYSSELQPRGPVYTTLARIPLHGGKDSPP